MAVWEAEDPDGFDEEFADCEKETGDTEEANIVLIQVKVRLVKMFCVVRDWATVVCNLRRDEGSKGIVRTYGQFDILLIY